MGEAEEFISPAGLPADDEALICPSCGYDLRGTLADRCSECGTPFDRAALRTSGFPWAHRRQIGRVRAYLRTVWLVTIGSRKLRYEMSRLQDRRDSRSFRRATAVLLSILMVGAFLAPMIARNAWDELAVRPESVYATRAPLSGWLQDVAVPWSAGATIPPVLPLMLVFLSFHVVGLPHTMFRVRNASAPMQERASAIGDYVMSPLLWLWPAALCYGVVALLDKGELLPESSLLGLALTGFGFIVSALLATVGRIAQWTARVRWAGLDVALLAIPWLAALYSLALLVWLCIVPWCIGYIWISIDSYR